MTLQDNETLHEFPCRISIKAFGAHDGDFEAVIHDIVSPHVPELTTQDISSRISSGGRYIAVTATINAQSKAQLDAIYYDLTADPRVVMSL